MAEQAPRIFGYEPGYHNSNMDQTVSRLTREAVYKDQSVIIIIPALNTVATKSASSWLNLMSPPNGKVVRLFATGMEVGNAYDLTIKQVLSHPELCNFKYILTLEADNTVPPDLLVKLISNMDEHPEYSCIGGLYFSKGEEHSGVAHLWGDPKSDPIVNYRPQVPVPNTLQETYGTSMGANLWRLDMFKDPRIEWPLFETRCSTDKGCFSQDLAAWHQLRKLGHRCCINTALGVGHVDMNTGFVW